MNKIKFSHLVFSVSLIAALALAVFPAAPAHALSSSATRPVLTANHVDATVLTPQSGPACRRIVVWINGHRTVIRRCHKVANPAS